MIVRLFIYVGYYLLNLAFLKDWLSFWLTLPIMLLVIYNAARIRDKYVGVSDMITFIMYLFFVIEPLQQIDHGHIGTNGPVSPITYHEYYLVSAALMVTIFYAVFTIVLQMLERHRKPAVELKMSVRKSEVLLLSAFVGWAGFVVLSGGLGNTLASRADKVTEDINVLAILALAIQMIATFVLATRVRLRFDRSLVYFVVAIAMLLVSANPFNVARFALISTYVPIAFILLRGRIVSSIFYSGALVTIVVIMPILSLTTRLGRAGLTIEDASTSSSLLSLPFLDVYDMLVECARFTDRNGFTYGEKLFGDLLFFVPRAIWTGKPTLNGLDIGTELAQDRIAGTANLSMFVAGDGYRDLGFIGVALVGLIVGLIVHYLIYNRPKIINGVPLLQYVFIASLPILIRGPIGAVLSLFFVVALGLGVLARYVAVPVAGPSGSIDLDARSSRALSNSAASSRPI